MNATELLALADELIRPTDPVEIRAGSKGVLALIARRPKAAAVLSPAFGLPVVIDESLAWGQVKVIARDGSTLADARVVR
jgi:hypothetical protein